MTCVYVTRCCGANRSISLLHLHRRSTAEAVMKNTRKKLELQDGEENELP